MEIIAPEDKLTFLQRQLRKAKAAYEEMVALNEWRFNPHKAERGARDAIAEGTLLELCRHYAEMIAAIEARR